MSREPEFKVGDVIGIYTITACAGKGEGGELYWEIVTPKGNDATFSSTRLRKELRNSKLSPEYITSLSGNAYKTLLDEVGEATIQKVLNKTKPTPKASPQQIQAAWDEFFKTYPQANFDSNVKILTAGLQALPNPTYTCDDIRSVYEEAISHGRLKLNLAAVGLDKKYKMTIVSNYDSLMRLSSGDYARLAFPVVQREPHEADPLTSEQVREINKKQNQRPESERETKSRDRILGFFFDIHKNLAASPEFQKTKTALIEYVKANQLPTAVQSFENALTALTADGTIKREETDTDPVQHYGGTTLREGAPRKRIAPTSPLLTNVAIVERKKNFTEQQIDAMTSLEYAEYLRSPEFREAVDSIGR